MDPEDTEAHHIAIAILWSLEGWADMVLLWLRTDAVGHLIPAEVEVRRIGLDHGRGSIKRTHLLIGAEIYKQTNGRRSVRRDMKASKR